METPIVVTGLGICCSVGNSVIEVVESLRAARTGLKPYKCEQAPNLTTRFAGTIDSLPESVFPSDLVQRWDRGTLLAAHAAREALHAARLAADAYAEHRRGLATGPVAAASFSPPPPIHLMKPRSGRGFQKSCYNKMYPVSRQMNWRAISVFVDRS